MTVLKTRLEFVKAVQLYMKKIALAVGVLLCFSVCHAQVIETRIVCPVELDWQWFGYAVAVADGQAVVGASRGDVPVEGAGSTYVFRRDSDSWSLAQLLEPDGLVDLDSFGFSVAVYGPYMLVAALHRGGFQAPGAVRVYKRDGLIWEETALLEQIDGHARDIYGSSVALAENYAIVGASHESTMSKDAGAAYIFERAGEEWALTATLFASDAHWRDNFGEAVAISDSFALVGAPEADNVNGEGAGAVYVYTRAGDQWIETAKLGSENGFQNDRFGSSVAFDGTHAIVGADQAVHENQRKGAAYVFAVQDGAFAQQAKLTAYDAERDDCFGTSVSISDNYALIGAPGALWGTDRAGSAYLFERQDDLWIGLPKFSPSQGGISDQFGRSASLSTDGNKRAIVGAPNTTDYGDWTGAVYIYDRFVPGVYIDTILDSLYTVVDENGAMVPFAVCITNTLSETQSVEYWTRIFDPLGIPLDTLLGPIEVVLSAADSICDLDSIPITGDAFGGDYQIVSYVGEYDQDTLAFSSAFFTKIPLPIPYVIDTIPDQTVIQGFTPYVVADMFEVFDDYDSEVLVYKAESEHINTSFVGTEANLLQLLSAPGFTGTSAVIVTATDEQPLSVRDTFLVHVEPLIGIKEEQQLLPAEFVLYQNYPNPFNPTTVIGYGLPESVSVLLTIYDVNGRVVKSAVNRQQSAGHHSYLWDGTDDTGREVASGVYIYRLSHIRMNSYPGRGHGGDVQIRKMLLVR